MFEGSAAAKSHRIAQYLRLAPAMRFERSRAPQVSRLSATADKFNGAGRSAKQRAGLSQHDRVDVPSVVGLRFGVS
jgi:hypothetical protein